ncbi:MAG: hypothetical protein LBF22_05650 [Deltaproteobacteria bacterium]|nr:hypothetical protein [Deltaproteobacteria bacterium]
MYNENPFKKMAKREMEAALRKMEADQGSTTFQNIEQDPNGIFSATEHGLRNVITKLANQERAEQRFRSESRRSLARPYGDVIDVTIEKNPLLGETRDGRPTEPHGGQTYADEARPVSNQDEHTAKPLDDLREDLKNLAMLLKAVADKLDRY